MATFETMMKMQSTTKMAATAVGDVSVQEINTALTHILESVIFSKAYRMSRLLRYLVETSVWGACRDLSEYAIGLEVFDRDPGTYYPGEDPVVRVQVGRLRQRLKTYYATLGNQTDVHVSIPLGNYKPVIAHRELPLNTHAQAEGDSGADININKSINMTINSTTEKTNTVNICETAQMKTMELLLSSLPLHYIAEDFLGRTFTRGVNEKLGQQLHRAFGSTLISYSALHDALISDTVDGKARIQGGARYFLEGSVAIDGQLNKANIRLIDARSNAIMWSQQFTRPAAASLAVQEQMAQQICEEVQRFLRQE
jgi:TolB-like protein